MESYLETELEKVDDIKEIKGSSCIDVEWKPKNVVNQVKRQRCYL